MVMRNINKIQILTLVTAVISLSSCWLKSGGNNTGIEYAPDMYYSKGYEAYSQFTDSNKYRYNPYFMSMREPAPGSVAVGQLDYKYAYDNTAEGYEAAGLNLQMPTNLTVKEQIEGERLYGIYCAVCHGEKGGNDGSVSSKQSSLKPSWANYQNKYIKELPAGKIYHTLTYGKNNMGSYASAITPKDRWAILAYVKRLSMMDSLGNVPAIIGGESTSNTNAKAEATAYDTKSEVVIDKAQSDKLASFISHIEFETGSAVIKKSSYKDLDNLVVLLKTMSGKIPVVKGFTDNSGDADKNIILSDDRAEAVKQYLVTKGIDANNLLAIGFGAMYPKANNNTAAGKQQNRRVEIGFKNK